MIQYWPNFVCELCTVRAVLGHELESLAEIRLLGLERMRLLDMAWYLAENTHKTYQTKLSQMVEFEREYGACILRPRRLKRPARGAELALMWCQEAYSLKASTLKRNEGSDLTLSFTTVRQFRAALGHYQLLDLAVADPCSAYFTQSRKLIRGPGRGTDGFTLTMHTAGLRARLGTHTRPSMALQDRHVRWLNDDLDRRYRMAVNMEEKRELALAGLANLVLWLLWLRSREVFDTDWEEVEISAPNPQEDQELLHKAGFVRWTLHESKSQRGCRVDTISAFRTLSGLSIGRWALRARAHSNTGPVFCHKNGRRWTSQYFRQKFLYPSLREQRALGDSALTPFDDSPGNRIEDKFWSLHCARRGGRSHVSTKKVLGGIRFRKATATQVYVHGRWSTTRSNEPIDKQYLHWTDWQRLQITLCCH